MNKIAIVIIVLMIGSTTAMAGYYTGQRRANVAVTPTPSPTPIVEGTSRQPTAGPDQPLPVVQNTSLPHNSWVQGTVDLRPVNTPMPTTVPTQVPESNDISINFVNTPSQVQSGQGFTVSWQVNGPSGMQSSDTALAIKYEVNKQSNGSSSSVNSNSTQSFGSFIIPKVFSTNLRYGGHTGVIHITASATVDGETISTERDIQLVE